RIAVLPLLAAVPDGEYLAGNVTEDLVDQLSVVPLLRVRPITRAPEHVSRDRDAREIGRAADVDVVLDGSLRRVGDAVRVSVRLVTVEDGFQLWAQKWDRSPATVLAVVDDAVSAIATALTADHAAPARAHAANDPRAQELYLRGRHAMNRSWWWE